MWWQALLPGVLLGLSAWLLCLLKCWEGKRTNMNIAFQWAHDIKNALDDKFNDPGEKAKAVSWYQYEWFATGRINSKYLLAKLLLIPRQEFFFGCLGQTILLLLNGRDPTNKWSCLTRDIATVEVGFGTKEDSMTIACYPKLRAVSHMKTLDIADTLSKATEYKDTITIFSDAGTAGVNFCIDRCPALAQLLDLLQTDLRHDFVSLIISDLVPSTRWPDAVTHVAQISLGLSSSDKLQKCVALLVDAVDQWDATSPLPQVVTTCIKASRIRYVQSAADQERQLAAARKAEKEKERLANMTPEERERREQLKTKRRQRRK